MSKIITLSAENFKILKAVEIHPSGEMIEICGRNGNGKSSVLDVITSALCGAEAIPDAPVRHGKTKAEISVDLGELKVTRRFTHKDDGRDTNTLTVQFADGTRPRSPQHVLDELAGHMIDPVAFIRSPGAQRIAYVRALVPYDWTGAATRRQYVYDKRTDINREIKIKEAQAGGMRIAGDPPARVDIADLTGQLRDAHAHNAALEKTAEHRRERLRAAQILDADADTLLHEADELEKKVMALRKLAETKQSQSSEIIAYLDELPPVGMPIDVGAFDAQLQAAMVRNKAADDYDRYAALKSTIAALKTQSEGLTSDIDAIDKAGAQALRDAALPVGEIGDKDLLVGGVPFSSLSQAQQITAAVQIAMAGMPKIKVILIRDGSLLDKSSMAQVAALAKGKDYQVWIERVTEGPSPGGILIVDGEVAP